MGLQLDPGPIEDQRLLLPEETVAEDWLELGPEPVQLIVGTKRRLLRVVYRRRDQPPDLLGGLSPIRRAWSRAHREELWLRRGASHPPLLRLAMITGHWGEMSPEDWVELRGFRLSCLFGQASLFLGPITRTGG